MSDISQKKFWCNISSIWNAVMNHYIMDCDSKYPKWWVWLTYANVRSVWNPLICNFFPDSWLLMSYISQKKLWCNISSIWNAVMHQYIIDFDSTYQKLWVWLTYANVRSVWQPIICNFFHWQLTPDVRYLTEKVLVPYIQHLNAAIHHYIMDFDSNIQKWWVWLTYANVGSVWNPLICNFFPWQLTPDVIYLTENVLLQYIQHLNAVMHHYIMDFDSKYPKWWVWLTYANVRSVWKPLICNFFPWKLAPDVGYLTENVLVQYIQHLNAVMHHYIMDFDSKYPKWWVLLTYDVRSVWKPLICNFFPWQLTPDVRYLTEKVLVQYIQHVNAVMHHYIMDFDSKYVKWWVWLTYADVRSMWKPLICNFFHCQLTPDVRYLIEKVLVQHIQNLNAVMHHYIMDSDSQYPKLWVWLTYANVRSVWKPLICNFFPDSWLLMSDISHKTFWCNISSIWTQLCIIISWILTQNIQHDGFGWHMQSVEVCESH